MNFPIRTLHQLRPILIGLRKKAGVSQAALAAQLGITQQSYAKIEASPTSTSFERLFTILQILGGELVLTDDVSAGAASVSEHSPIEKTTTGTPPTLNPPNKESW